MAKERFLYLPVGLPADEAHPQGSTAYRPTVLVRVFAASFGPIRVPCVLDTGADCCLLPSGIAKSLGFDLASLPQSSAKGIGNQAIDVFYGHVTIS